MLRWKLNPLTWEQLSQSQQIDLLAYEHHLMKALETSVDSLIEQKAYMPDVAFMNTLARLGLI